jgi:hypothetical protein
MEIIKLAHRWVRDVLFDGALAIDATVGNGHDTLFLARCVGPAGTVLGFEVQEAALSIARRHAEEACLGGRIRFYLESHAGLADRWQQDFPGQTPQAVLFNLGYLPGGDKQVTTRLESTLTALEASIALLAPGGLISVVLYPGHEEGARETEAVLAWAKALAGPWEVTLCQPLNRSPRAPRLLVVERPR